MLSSKWGRVGSEYILRGLVSNLLLDVQAVLDCESSMYGDLCWALLLGALLSECLARAVKYYIFEESALRFFLSSLELMEL